MSFQKCLSEFLSYYKYVWPSKTIKSNSESLRAKKNSLHLSPQKKWEAVRPVPSFPSSFSQNNSTLSKKSSQQIRILHQRWKKNINSNENSIIMHSKQPLRVHINSLELRSHIIHHSSIHPSCVGCSDTVDLWPHLQFCRSAWQNSCSNIQGQTTPELGIQTVHDAKGCFLLRVFKKGSKLLDIEILRLSKR